MSDMLDSDLRAWLADRQRLAAQLTSAPAVIERVEALLAPRRRRARVRPLLAGLAAAAVLGTAITVPSVLHLRSGSVPAVDGLPPGVPATPPPDGVPLVWYQPPSPMENLYVAYDWSGRPAGSLRLARTVGPGGFKPSDDGETVLVQSYDGHDRLLTASGRQLAELSDTKVSTGPNSYSPFNLVFASDGRTFCEDYGFNGAPTLHVIDASGRNRAVVAEVPPQSPDYLSWHVAACNAQTDRAVLVGTPGPRAPAGPPLPQPTPEETTLPNGMHSISVGGVAMGGAVYPRVPAGGIQAMVRVVRLSTGAEVWRHSYGPTEGRPGSASTDTRWLAETSVPGNVSAIRDLVSGAITGHVRGIVSDFLGGGADVLESPSLGSFAVVDVASGRTIWQTSFPARTFTARSLSPTLPWMVLVTHFDGPWRCGSVRLTYVTAAGSTAEVHSVDAC
jgi:hypothetical protein